MKVVVHERSPKPMAMTLSTNPLSVFVTKTVEVRIQRGDTLAEVAKVVRQHMPDVREHAAEIVALWFAMGERARRLTKSTAGWSKKELATTPTRKYDG